MVQTSSGFELSEIDMQLRGFGDIAGTRQSGLDQLKLASLNTDSTIAEKAREAVIEILSEDSKLLNHQNLYVFMREKQGYTDWENIA
jgi:ATP-dependent DNA helicase RecG